MRPFHIKTFCVSCILLFTITTYSQDTTDAERLAKLEYMSGSDKVDCDNQMGAPTESRICLNLKFQRLDSILNHRFITYIGRIKNDSLKNVIIDYQTNWVLNRRNQSSLFIEGLGGSALGINYLWAMNNTTELRIRELESLMAEH